MDMQTKVGIVVLNKKGEVLLIKERLKGNPEPLWNIIKGSYGGGETIFDAAKRECKEEASLVIELKQSLGVFVSNEGEKIRVQFNFLAEPVSGTASTASKAEQQKLGESIEELRWFSVSEISKLKPADFISQRTFEVLQNWMSGKSYPLDTFQHDPL